MALAEAADRADRAAVYAIESAQPAISRVKVDGLREHYGDVEHAAEGRALLAARLDGADEDALVAEAERVPRANWGLLDGVERLCERWQTGRTYGCACPATSGRVGG